MEFNIGWNNRHDSRGIPPETSCHSHFADQTCQVCCTGPDFRRNKQEFFHQGPPVHTHHMHGGILREIEKEKITEEILIAEIVRRRTLEAEVKMIERELALLRREQHFSFQPSPQINHDLQMSPPLSVAEADCSSLEENFSKLLDEIKKMSGRHESRGYDSQAFHGRMEDLAKKDEHISGSKKMDLAPSKVGSNETDDPPAEQETKFTSQCFWSNETEVVESRKLESPPLQQNQKLGNMKIQTKSTVGEERSADARIEQSLWCDMCNVGPLPWNSMIAHLKGKKHANLIVKNYQNGGALSQQYISGSKKMDLAPSEVGSSKLPKTDQAKQNNRDEWNFALCKFGATSEQALSEHLDEKKHKRRVYAMRQENARKNYSIGLLSKRATNSTNVIKPVDPPAEQEAKLTTQCFLSNETEVAESRNLDSPPLRKNIKLSNLTNQTISTVREEKSDDANKWHRLWCDMCKVGPVSWTTMIDHLKGKKHANLQLLQQNSKHCKFKNEAGSVLMGKGSGDARKRYMFWCVLCQLGPLSHKAMLGHEKGKKHADTLMKKINQNCEAGPSDFYTIPAPGNHAHQVARSEKMGSDNVDETSDTIKLEGLADTTKNMDDCLVGVVKSGDHVIEGTFQTRDDGFDSVCADKSRVHGLMAADNGWFVVDAKSEDHSLVG